MKQPPAVAVPLSFQATREEFQRFDGRARREACWRMIIIRFWPKQNIRARDPKQCGGVGG